MAETPTAQTASLEGIEGELLGAIAKAADLGALEEVRVAALGKKGRVSELMQTLGRMAPEERKNFGQAVNQLKDRVGEALEAKREALCRVALSARLAASTSESLPPLRFSSMRLLVKVSTRSLLLSVITIVVTTWTMRWLRGL